MTDLINIPIGFKVNARMGLRLEAYEIHYDHEGPQKYRNTNMSVCEFVWVCVCVSDVRLVKDHRSDE